MNRSAAVWTFLFCLALIITGGLFCFAPLWQPGYAPAAPQPFAAEQLLRVDLNAADEAALQSLPGLGEKKAAAIVGYRASNGPFASIEQLAQIKGISESNVEAWRPYLYIETSEQGES